MVENIGKIDRSVSKSLPSPFVADKMCRAQGYNLSKMLEAGVEIFSNIFQSKNENFIIFKVLIQMYIFINLRQLLLWIIAWKYFNSY